MKQFYYSIVVFKVNLQQHINASFLFELNLERCFNQNNKTATQLLYTVTMRHLCILKKQSFVQHSDDRLRSV